MSELGPQAVIVVSFHTKENEENIALLATARLPPLVAVMLSDK